METRGNRILIGVAIALAVIVALLRGCVWIAVHMPEPQVIEIKDTPEAQLGLKANQLAQNEYSEDLVFEYRVIGSKLGERVKNRDKMTLRVGDRIEARPWKLSRGSKDELQCMPYVMQLTPEGNQEDLPVAEEPEGYMPINLRAVKPGYCSLAFLISYDSRLGGEAQKQGLEYYGAVIINLQVE